MDTAPRQVVVSRSVLERLDRRARTVGQWAAIAGFVAGLAAVPAAAWILELLS